MGITYFVDVSGSTLGKGNVQQRAFETLIELARRGAKGTVVLWDTQVRDEFPLSEEGLNQRVPYYGGGGTDLRCILPLMIDAKMSIVFTDGMMLYPAHGVKMHNISILDLSNDEVYGFLKLLMGL